MELRDLSACIESSEGNSYPHTPGNADDYQRKGFAGKAIRNYLKAQDMQIDRPGGATHKYMKTKGARK